MRFIATSKQRDECIDYNEHVLSFRKFKTVKNIFIMAIFDSIVTCLFFSALTRGVSAAYCYYYSRYYYYYSYYCPSYYSYYYYYYSYSTDIGVIIGAIVGGIIGFIILISVIVAICCACKKSSGVRGTVIQPVQPNVSVVQSSQQQQMGGYTQGYPQAYPQPQPMMNPPPYPPPGAVPPAYPPPTAGISTANNEGPPPPVYAENVIGGQPPKSSGFNGP